MNPREAKDLSIQVVKQSDCIIKFGSTNGRSCLHLRLLQAEDPSRSSVTLYSEAEWAEHPWNKTNRPRKKRKSEPELSIVEVHATDVVDSAIAEAVANREAI